MCKVYSTKNTIFLATALLRLFGDYALPFSSLPKYAVHLSLRASLPSANEFFLHLLEQNHKTDPSFLTYIIPVPDGNSLPQNEHLLGLGKGDPSTILVFRVYLVIRFVSPICMISSVTPVRQMIWIASAGLSSSAPAFSSLLINLLLFSTLQFLQLFP